MSDKPLNKLDCLDALRGLAVLLVIFYHLRSGDGNSYHPAIGSFLELFRYGFTGVTLFLVLSGFCLTHSMIRRSQAARMPTYGSYMSARWWRIAPPFYAAMAIYLLFPVVYMLIGRESPQVQLLSVRQIGSHLLFLHGLLPDTIYAINTPFWSLSLEFQFYLALPLIFLAARRFGFATVLAVVAAASLTWRIALLRTFPEMDHLVRGGFLLGRLTEFVFGMGLAFWYNAPDRGWLGRLTWPSALGVAAALLYGAAVLQERKHGLFTDYIFGAGYTALVMAALLAAERGGGPGRLVGWPPLVAVGMISYSLYLIHGMAMERTIQLYRRFVRHGPNLVGDFLLVLVVLGIVMISGWAFFRLVERHFLRSVDAKREEPRALLRESSSLVDAS